MQQALLYAILEYVWSLILYANALQLYLYSTRMDNRHLVLQQLARMVVAILLLFHLAFRRNGNLHHCYKLDHILN